MRTKTVYIMERKEVEILRKAKSIINLLCFAEVEFEDDRVEQELLSDFGDIEDLIIDSIDLNELDKDDFDDYDDEEDDDSDEPYTYCECCGRAIQNSDDVCYGINGCECCCVSCVNEMDAEEEDEE